VASELERLRASLADRYGLVRELGHGGMAKVYLAQDLKHGRPVALKVLKSELAHALGPERFLREIRLTAQLDHPHILPLLDSGDAGEFLYYVMPYVDGESLRERLTREKQLPLEDAFRIAREVADALSYAHSHGIVHRDIKPENVLLAGQHARVADFGIARAVTAAGGETLTGTGLAIGTPTYMSPEQANGEKDLDGRSDVYSLGCVLYEMLAGHPPFTGGTAREILVRHSMDVVPSLSAARPTVSPDLERVIATALAKTPADRFRTAALFAEALARPQSVAMPPAATVPGATSTRRARRLALVGVAGLVALGGVLLMLRRGSEASAPAEPAYERTAIAVLPFQNLSAEGPQAYFASGLHNELVTQLSKVAALKVISRTSVMSYVGTGNHPLRQIANQLRVGSLVEGSVQVVGGRLRVNVQLIDAATDANLWAERYDRTLDDAFAIQSDVAQRIVAAVGAALSGA
jgi:eukaryotic-like serine/threonine-protein kinase